MSTTTLEGVKVKTCPFCGDFAELKQSLTFAGFTYYWVKCHNLKCGTTTQTQDTPEKAITRWNNRAPE